MKPAQAATAVVERPQVPARIAPAPDAVEALRTRLAGQAAREHALLDLLSEDLREARAALTGVTAWVESVEAALGDGAPAPERVLALALGGGAVEGAARLGEGVAALRRRLAQVAARM